MTVGEACSELFSFGKYINCTLQEVAEKDPGYMVWANACVLFKDPLFKEAFDVVYAHYELDEYDPNGV